MLVKSLGFVFSFYYLATALVIASPVPKTKKRGLQEDRINSPTVNQQKNTSGGASPFGIVDDGIILVGGVTDGFGSIGSPDLFNDVVNVL